MSFEKMPQVHLFFLELKLSALLKNWTFEMDIRLNSEERYRSVDAFGHYNSIMIAVHIKRFVI